jgi:hypothetical protein
MYTGKEICQGCKKTGQEERRFYKNDLCEPCKNVLRKGNSIEFENNIEYIQVKDWYNGFNSIEFRDKSLDTLANRFFESLNNRYAKTLGFENTKRSQPHGYVFYNIPKDIFEHLNNFLNELNINISEIKKMKEDSEEYARNAVREEKNKIYNEGVEKGRELLFSLNNGSITMEDFNKRINKF